MREKLKTVSVNHATEKPSSDSARNQTPPHCLNCGVPIAETSTNTHINQTDELPAVALPEQLEAAACVFGTILAASVFLAGFLAYQLFV